MKAHKDRLILFNKPFQVLCQFSGGHPGRSTLAEYIKIPDVYPAGRLDYDSEGLLLLTDSGALHHLITNPRRKTEKTYLAQVEGSPGADALDRLRRGVRLQDGMTLPAKARLVETPDVWPRVPAIRYRKSIPTAWLELKIVEGRNRQVRRMTAAVGHPTLRLIRVRVGRWELGDLEPGTWKEIEVPGPEKSK
ncbi:MAG: pseudouridine synthase [Candidatus Krumholzibacteria bacterium]|nr:pseudouridine synthase [Candidatus Krumholzibacteria bacterium]